MNKFLILIHWFKTLLVFIYFILFKFESLNRNTHKFKVVLFFQLSRLTQKNEFNLETCAKQLFRKQLVRSDWGHVIISFVID